MEKTKRLSLYTLTVLLSLFVSAQDDGVSIGVSRPNEKAVLHVQSDGSFKGMLIPRYSTNDRNSINPASSADNESGLIIYNTDINAFEYFDGTNWLQLIPTPAKFNVNMAGNRIVNLADGIGSNDAASKGQVDDVDANNLDLDGSDRMVGNLNMGSNRIQNLSPSITGTDAVNQNELEALRTDLGNEIEALRNSVGILRKGSRFLGDVPGGDIEFTESFPSLGNSTYIVLGSIRSRISAGDDNADNDLHWSVKRRSDTQFTILVQELRGGVQSARFDYILISR